MDSVISGISVWMNHWSLPSINLIDIIEIFLISFFVYQFMVWIQNSRAYALLKGILVVLIFIMIAYLFKMNTILWVVRNVASVLMIGMIIIFQPELRKVLEQLGQKQIIASIFSFDTGKEAQERFTDRTINEIVKACAEMAEAKTGALIVMERGIRLSEYERTGILIDSTISSQLLVNIFEHNTPLHDGAVILRDNRISAATCYLPLSDNMELSKQLGTRHRAGVGISEVSDSFTIIVSEETGKISVAESGVLRRNIDIELLRTLLVKTQNKKVVDNSKLRQLIKGRIKHGKENTH